MPGPTPFAPPGGVGGPPQQQVQSPQIQKKAGDGLLQSYSPSKERALAGILSSAQGPSRGWGDSIGKLVSTFIASRGLKGQEAARKRESEDYQSKIAEAMAGNAEALNLDAQGRPGRSREPPSWWSDVQRVHGSIQRTQNPRPSPLMEPFQDGFKVFYRRPGGAPAGWKSIRGIDRAPSRASPCSKHSEVEQPEMGRFMGTDGSAASR